MRRSRWTTGGTVLATTVLLASCVPADEALGRGSVQFTITASSTTQTGIYPGADDGGYRLDFDRVVLGFKTMTVGKIGAPDTCSYRGRGATSDAVFRPLGPAPGLVQTFNGIAPVECPDVGAIFGVPGDETVLDANATSADLIELASNGLHALIDATATPRDDLTPPTKIQLRFNPLTTSTRFGGCREGNNIRTAAEGKGVRIFEQQRDTPTVYFAAENLFRSVISSSGPFRIRPFVLADERGDNDGVATMTEIDELPLSAIPNGEFYQVPVSTTADNIAGRYPSLGDFVRFLFRFTLLFRSEGGLCTGNEPGGGNE